MKLYNNYCKVKINKTVEAHTQLDLIITYGIKNLISMMTRLKQGIIYIPQYITSLINEYFTHTR